ncbi:MAG: hypothetical protein Sylvanvirus18_5 [Sylvanvirus sp.]|uniref:Uncharacterized protein n=1 Tax=Sylvanvirus sp. TaxID=2487774 RepID=A0A3G5AIG6_9VIRU|nr:MAG: hypothetical protein Sylvanvirus18_5 [Sylvanvirus sp.]
MSLPNTITTGFSWNKPPTYDSINNGSYLKTFPHSFHSDTTKTNGDSLLHEINNMERKFVDYYRDRGCLTNVRNREEFWMNSAVQEAHQYVCRLNFRYVLQCPRAPCAFKFLHENVSSHLAVNIPSTLQSSFTVGPTNYHSNFNFPSLDRMQG